MPFQTSTNHYQNTKYIVDAAGGTPYATVQSAINAANTAGIPATVFIRAGTYAENLTLYNGIELQGSNAFQTVITGKHTPPNAGRCALLNLGLASATHILDSAAAVTATIKFSQCAFNLTNGYVCNMTNWTGTMTFEFCSDTSTINGLIINTATAAITMNNCTMGVGTANPMTINGILTVFNCALGCSIALSGAAISIADGGSSFTNPIVVSGTANVSIANSRISTGAATAITITSTIPLQLSDVNIATSNAVAIAGTGTVNFNQVNFSTSKALAGTIVEGLSGVVKTGENYSNTILRMDMTGFYSWAAAGPYYDATTLGTFQLLVGGTGYIRGKLITWVAQNIAGMTSGATWYIYIDSTGTIGKTSTRTDLLFQDYIVLFECLYDETTGTKQQHVVRENHPYNYPTSVSNYAHDVIGTVIENANNGANIVAGTTGVRVSISGADVLVDHGLDTDIPAATDRTWKKFYKNAGGKWAVDATGTDFQGRWNNAGTPTALTANRFGVYRLYVCKDDLNATTPTYYAVLDTSEYTNAGNAASAIAAGTIAIADGELMALELAQLGFITFRQSTGVITVFNVAKSTLRSTISGGVGSSTASGVTTNTAAFNGILSGSDTNVQAALDTIDNWGATSTNHGVLIGKGTGVAIGATAAGLAGQALVSGGAAADPVWTTATYPATVATGDILAATNTNVITVIPGTTATATYVLTGNGSGVLPTWQAASAGGITWSIQTIDLNPMVPENGYIANKAGLLTFTLPTTCAIGKTLRVSGMNTDLGWKIAQNASQIIHFAGSDTSTGVGGYLASTLKRDSVELVCVVANLEFNVVSSVGNITIV